MNFNYIELKLKGCNLEAGLCASEDEVNNITINYYGLTAHPTLGDDDDGEILKYVTEQSYIRYVDPYYEQSANIFFMESVVSMSGSLFDIFEQNSIEKKFFEENNRVYYNKRMPENLPLHDKEYLRIFMRHFPVHRIYRLEGYDVLTYLGDLGGLFEIAFSLGKLLSAMFIGNFFQVALIRAAYKIQNEIASLDNT